MIATFLSSGAHILPTIAGGPGDLERMPVMYFSS
jgi:hypothetical protein